MNCPQCSAELSNSATFCPRCGTSLRPTSFSYLPAGAPPWPNTPPQGYSYGPAAAVQTPQTTAPATASVPVPKPRRSAGAVLLVIALLALSVVLGAGGTLGVLALNGQLAPGSRATASSIPKPVATPGPGTPSATPATTPQGNLLPTPSSFITINSQAVGVSLKYPGDWIADPPQSNSNSATVNLHPQQQIGVRSGAQTRSIRQVFNRSVAIRIFTTIVRSNRPMQLPPLLECNGPSGMRHSPTTLTSFFTSVAFQWCIISFSTTSSTLLPVLLTVRPCRSTTRRCSPPSSSHRSPTGRAQ